MIVSRITPSQEDIEKLKPKGRSKGRSKCRTNLYEEDLDFINAVKKIKTNEDVTDENLKPLFDYFNILKDNFLIGEISKGIYDCISEEVLNSFKFNKLQQIIIGILSISDITKYICIVPTLSIFNSNERYASSIFLIDESYYDTLIEKGLIETIKIINDFDFGPINFYDFKVNSLDKRDVIWKLQQLK